jgi:hypothetical protein
MTVLTDPPPSLQIPDQELVASAPPSPAGPIEVAELAMLPRPPAVHLPRFVQVPWFGQRQTGYVFRNRSRFGEVWTARGYVRGTTAVTHHPDHIRSLFTAPPELVPTLAEESHGRDLQDRRPSPAGHARARAATRHSRGAALLDAAGGEARGAYEHRPRRTARPHPSTAT